MSKPYKTQHGRFTMEWTKCQQDQEVNVDVYDEDDTLVLQWAYPLIPGHKSLAAAAALWAGQAAIQAEAELEAVDDE